jgi:hypothetical protein
MYMQTPNTSQHADTDLTQNDTQPVHPQTHTDRLPQTYNHTHTHTHTNNRHTWDRACSMQAGSHTKKASQLCENVHPEIQQETHTYTHTKRTNTLTLTLLLKIHHISRAQGRGKVEKSLSKASVRQSERHVRLKTCGVELNKKEEKKRGKMGGGKYSIRRGHARAVG